MNMSGTGGKNSDIRHDIAVLLLQLPPPELEDQRVRTVVEAFVVEALEPEGWGKKGRLTFHPLVLAGGAVAVVSLRGG